MDSSKPVSLLKRHIPKGWIIVQINVSQLLKESIGATRNYKVSGIVDIGDIESQVEGEVSLTRTDRGILAKGTLQTSIKLTCCRCLSLFSCPLSVDIEDEYFPTIDIPSGAPLPLPDDPDIFTIDEHNILDLTEAIRQYGLLAIPMKPLCRQDCAGLCPPCGGNLNQSACSCPTKPIDERWFELIRLASANKQASVNEQKGTK